MSRRARLRACLLALAIAVGAGDAALAAAPTVRVTTAQRDIVETAVLRAFDASRWEATVRLLADNGGTRSRFAWRVRDAALLNGHPLPDAAADMAADWI